MAATKNVKLISARFELAPTKTTALTQRLRPLGHEIYSSTHRNIHISRSAPGIEPGTSSTLRKNHTPRPSRREADAKNHHTQLLQHPKYTKYETHSPYHTHLHIILHPIMHLDPSTVLQYTGHTPIQTSLYFYLYMYHPYTTNYTIPTLAMVTTHFYFYVVRRELDEPLSL